MQYRADFIISSIGMALSNIIGILLFWVLFNTIPSLAGWSFNELLFIYGFYLLALSPPQILFDNIWSLRTKVWDGSFIKYYFRPLNMMFYYMSEVVDIKGFTEMAIGILCLIYASNQLGLHWSVLKVLVLIAMISTASLVMVSLLIIAGASAFWITNSFPVLAFAFKLREFAFYPITIFDGFFRIVFTYLIPLGFIAFYPAQIFLRPQDISLTVYMSPLVGVVFFALAYKVWSMGVNHYTGTGT
jgi:ABC-2 type transport system permease protein